MEAIPILINFNFVEIGAVQVIFSKIKLRLGRYYTEIPPRGKGNNRSSGATTERAMGRLGEFPWKAFASFYFNIFMI